ncbi:MAG: hypothetical protein NVS2B12_03780 [Ktedonobacteraceae bacterium]
MGSAPNAVVGSSLPASKAQDALTFYQGDYILFKEYHLHAASCQLSKSAA